MCPKDEDLEKVIDDILKISDADVPVNVKPHFSPYLRFISGYRTKSEVKMVCGDRSIMIRAATGEQGPMGPFPFITLTEEKEEGGKLIEGYCVHCEAVFDKLWDKLKELATK